MNLNLIQHKNETEVLSLSKTENCETLIEQTYRKAEETLQYKNNKSRKTFLFDPLISIEGSWMIGLTDLEVYNSLFNITEENNNFQLFKFLDEKAGGVSYEKVRDEIERDLDIADITAVDIQDDIIGQIIIEEYKKQVSKRMEDGAYTNFLACYQSFIFQAFEAYLRTENEIVEDDVRLVLDKYNSSFVNYKITPGKYSFKDLSSF